MRADPVAALCDEGEALLEARSPADALFAWLRSYITTQRTLAADAPLFEDRHESVHATASALLTRAQRSGVVRADLTATDLLTMANGIALASTDPDQTRRLLRFLRRGAS
ncbi:SbtR family transcriptional regulator [Actinomadura rudentiformis]|uniref:Transcriptional regulator SbtR-like C-terminal domain-containing protein n=1 Tax=Actinomadura rudentiformis TaxID=359158 RepID=A0A6H9YJG2_9ACTN|nr:hypothetical protein [Actinomadura rudentiformis]KAB2344417.1 hypothetical protein F8566_31290 [Actinomadura rudentiformis]